MHFRVRKNVIQLIRIDYDARKKRGVNRIVGTVSQDRVAWCLQPTTFWCQ